MAGVAINSSEIGQSEKMINAVNKLRGLGMSDGAMVALVDVFYGAITNGYDNFIQLLNSSRPKPGTGEPDYSPKKDSFTTEAVEDTSLKAGILVKENAPTAPRQTETDSLQDRVERFGGNWLALRESGAPGPGNILEIKPPGEKRKRGRPRKIKDPAIIASCHLENVKMATDKAEMVGAGNNKDFGLLATPVITKVCVKCGKKKSIAEYHLKNQQRPSLGYRDECKRCDVKALALADDDEARAFLKLLSTIIPKGFPVGRPEKFENIWNLIAISDHIGGNEGRAAKYMSRLSTWGYIGRHFVNRKRGYTFWITELGMNAIKKMEAEDAKAATGRVCEAIKPNKAAAV